MSFFQNLFDDYEGYWAMGDWKGYSLTFKAPGNKNRGEAFICWNAEPYDLSVDGNLTINFALDQGFKNWASVTVDVAGDAPSATLAAEVRDALNATPGFSDWFTAGTDGATRAAPNNGAQRVYIRQKKPITAFRTYISNTGAELALKFNKYGGVADLPSYFDKHTLANRFTNDDGNFLCRLIRLSHPISAATADNPSEITSVGHGLSSGDTIYIVGSNTTPTIDGERVVTVTGDDTFTVPVTVTTAGSAGEWLSAAEQQIVADVGLDYSAMLADWEHLRGRTGGFTFTKNTLDGDGRITSQIKWQAGATAGMLAKKTVFTYTDSNTTPDGVMEIPYVLTESDLITP